MIAKRTSSGAPSSLLLCGLLGLAGCTDEWDAPAGFTAVIPQQIDTSQTGCPKLIGRYLLGDITSRNRMMADLPGSQTPAMTYLTFDEQVGSSAYNYSTWMTKSSFLLAAQKLRSASSADYYEWRKLTLEMLAVTSGFPAPTLVDEVSAHGPVYSRKAQLHSYGCEGGWMKILETGMQAQSDQGNYTQQWDLWLGRDTAGDLLLHTIVYREQPGWTFWAAGGAGVRLIPEQHQWHKLQQAPDGMQPELLDAGELPAVSPPRSSIDCNTTHDVDTLVQFNQALLTRLPTGVTLEKFLPQPRAATDACNRQVVHLGLSAPATATEASVLQAVQQDQQIERATVLEAGLDARQQRQLLLEITLKSL